MGASRVEAYCTQNRLDKQEAPALDLGRSDTVYRLNVIEVRLSHRFRTIPNGQYRQIDCPVSTLKVPR